MDGRAWWVTVHRLATPLCVSSSSYLVTTNLDSMLKSRDIILATNVSIVKAVVPPVVMYGSARWTIKKDES